MNIYLILLFLLIAFIVWRIITNIVKTDGLKPEDTPRKCVLISGCDSGFGNKLALKLVSNGVYTFAGCFTDGGAQLLRDEAKTLGSDQHLVTLPLDVASQESVEKAVAYVKKTLTPKQVLWALVNNAGIPCAGPEDWMNVEDYQQGLNVNCLGVIRMSQQFMPLLKQSKGRVVTVTSLYARWAQAWGGPYAVSKCGVQAYMDCLRNEVSVYGVGVHVIEPGFFRTYVTSTDGLLERLNFLWNRLPASVKEEYGDEYVQKSHKAASVHLKWLIDGNRGIDEVVDDYYRAITVRWPRQRYYPGSDMKKAILILWLPTSFLDLLQEIFIKYRGYPTPKSMQKQG